MTVKKVLIETKVCKVCGETKPLTKEHWYLPYLTVRCKKCEIKRSVAWHKAKREAKKLAKSVEPKVEPK